MNTGIFTELQKTINFLFSFSSVSDYLLLFLLPLSQTAVDKRMFTAVCKDIVLFKKTILQKQWLLPSQITDPHSLFDRSNLRHTYRFLNHLILPLSSLSLLDLCYITLSFLWWSPLVLVCCMHVCISMYVQYIRLYIQILVMAHKINILYDVDISGYNSQSITYILQEVQHMSFFFFVTELTFLFKSSFCCSDKKFHVNQFVPIILLLAGLYQCYRGPYCAARLEKRFKKCLLITHSKSLLNSFSSNTQS